MNNYLKNSKNNSLMNNSKNNSLMNNYLKNSKNNYNKYLKTIIKKLQT
jgi:hypothetical protein